MFSVSLSDPFISAEGCVLFLAFMLMTEGGRLVTHMFNSTVNILSFSSPRILPLYFLTLVYLSQSFLPPLNQYRSAIMHESSQASPLNQSCRSLCCWCRISCFRLVPSCISPKPPECISRHHIYFCSPKHREGKSGN